jgi:hypothetical protein
VFRAAADALCTSCVSVFRMQYFVAVNVHSVLFVSTVHENSYLRRIFSKIVARRYY